MAEEDHVVAKYLWHEDCLTKTREKFESPWDFLSPHSSSSSLSGDTREAHRLSEEDDERPDINEYKK